MNKLFVLPTIATQQYLHNIFSDISVEIEYETLCVEVGSSVTPIVPDINRIYRALPGPMNIWYETAVGHSWLILPLIPSPEMADRHDEIGDAWGRDFIPYMVLSGKFNNTFRVKPKLNSIATMLIDTLPDLHFHAETLMQDSATVPSQSDFYNDYHAKGRDGRQLFLELTAR